jgi:acyl carrier protein
LSNENLLVDVVLDVANEFNSTWKVKIAVDRGLNASLYGQDGVLDSLGLVSFVVAVEQAVQERLGIQVALADDRAMSQRHSPFRTVGSLVEYISALVPSEELRKEV